MSQDRAAWFYAGYPFQGLIHMGMSGVWIVHQTADDPQFNASKHGEGFFRNLDDIGAVGD